MTQDDSIEEEVKTLEDACLGLALMIDANQDPTEAAESGSDPFMSILMQVLEFRGEQYRSTEQHAELESLWDTIVQSFQLPGGSMEKLAQRGHEFGDELRNPTFDVRPDEQLVAVAETDSGRTIWAVNADGWDDEAFEQENVTLGVGSDGTIQPVTDSSG